MSKVWSGSRTMSLDELVSLARTGEKITIDAETFARVRASRLKLESFVERGRVIYGVNTSVGGLVHMLVPIEHAAALQANLLSAVASNVDKPLDDQTVRATMLARIVSLSRGHSAISEKNFRILVEMFNRGIVPVVPEKGSLGTSGDLGPLAAIALVAIGQGKARYRGQLSSGSEALAAAGIEPMKLSYKEGLALVNGTSAMVALAAINLSQARQVVENYIDISALTFEGLAAKTKPFDPRVHRLKPHKGQQYVAERLWKALKGTRMAVNEADVEAFLSNSMNSSVQAGSQAIEDAYSIRCSPQILGPVIDSLAATAGTIEAELNSSNDNPLLIAEEDEVFHNGHFHGQYISTAMDHLAVALTTVCNLADRRVDRFLTPANSNGLPSFLCSSDPGLRLGLMGGQFMSTSVTAETRALTVPISIQTLTSTGDFQDVVSLGFVAARRVKEILRNITYVLGFELLCACQAADIRGAERLGPASARLYSRFRKLVPFLDADICLTDHLEAARTFVHEQNLAATND